MDNKQFVELIGKHFGVNEDDRYIELETWTSGGVNMFVNIDIESDESYLEQFKDYVSDFNVDEEIDTHRQDPHYRNDFTVRKSLEDFEDYHKRLKSIVSELDNASEN